MPQCRTEIQNLIDKWFPNEKYESQDFACVNFLESHGWILNKGSWDWKPPVPSHTQNFFEYICITYLIEEWDFGGEKDWIGARGRCYCDECLKEKIQ